MGGLAGLLDYEGGPSDLERLREMGRRLASRGPDGEGSWAEGPVALTHRLRRIGPGRDTLPLVTDDVVLLLDGWIHEPEALIRSVEPDLPHARALVEAWRRWGPDFPEHVDGAFAVVLWDRREKALYLYRDRLGMRPLYWTGRSGRYAFASELPALLAVPWVSRELAREYVSEYLSFQVVHAPRTLLRDVRQVEPGHVLRLDAGGEEARAWWRLRYAPPGAPKPREGEVVEQLRQAVQRAVRRRVPRGVDTGLYLSGGVGSSAIAAAARDQFLPLEAFTVRFDDDPHPESPFAGRVASLLGLAYHEVPVGSAELAERFEETVAQLGHPVGHPAVFLQAALARAARGSVPVVLAGDGGEELFGGRMLARLGQGLRMAGRLTRLPDPIRGRLGRWLGPRARRLVLPAERWVLELGIGGSKLVGTDERARLLRDHGLVRPALRREVLEPFYRGLDTDPVNVALHGWLRSWLVEGSLVRADRTAAATGLEIRFPLLDREVVEAAAALPGSFKLKRVGGALATRWPLRAMLGGVLPPPLVDRPKRGLPTPLDAWLAGPGRLFFEERYRLLCEDPYELWRPEALADLRRQVGRHHGAGIRLWTLLILDAWLRGLAR